MVKKSLNTTHNAFIKEAGQGVEFECETRTTRSILRLFPRATYRWTLNDGPLTMEPERMVFRMGDLIIQGLKATDTGLYSCRLHYTERKVITVGVFSLYVNSQYQATRVIEGREIHLQCNSHLLGILYSGSVKNWYLNGELTSLKKIPAIRKYIDIIKKSSAQSQGNWTCVVHNPVSGNNWTTAYYNITLLPAPTGFAYIVDYAKHNIKKSILITIGFFCVVMVISSIFIDMVDKKKRLQRKLEKRIQYAFLEESGVGHYDNDDNFCYTDKDGNVVVCKESDDDEDDSSGTFRSKMKNVGKKALENTKALIEGDVGESDENEDDANRNAGDVNSTQGVLGFNFSEDIPVTGSEDSFTEDNFEASVNEDCPLLSRVNYNVSFR